MSAAERETKDSGERVEFASGMQRDVSEGKPRFDLIMPVLLPYQEQMLYRWAMLMARGAAKYSDRNWEQAETVEELARFQESADRHYFQWRTGETDEDHAAAVMYNVAGAEYVAWRLEYAEEDADLTRKQKITVTLAPFSPFSQGVKP